MTESVTPKEERLVDLETGETPPLSPPPKCRHPLTLDCCPAYCAICHEQIEDYGDAA